MCYGKVLLFGFEFDNNKYYENIETNNKKKKITIFLVER